MALMLKYFSCQTEIVETNIRSLMCSGLALVWMAFGPGYFVTMQMSKMTVLAVHTCR